MMMRLRRAGSMSRSTETNSGTLPTGSTTSSSITLPTKRKCLSNSLPERSARPCCRAYSIVTDCHNMPLVRIGYQYTKMVTICIFLICDILILI